MMCPRAGQDPTVLPLLDWPERIEIERLEDERRDLHAQIVALPRHAHRRIELQARLKLVTQQQLELERALDGKARP